jgi:Asp-tRNA(Asn)/Glu-tRNA(Gln) amidotransferase A subunit family amidase
LDVIGWHAASLDYAKAFADVLLPRLPVSTAEGLRGLKVAITLHGDAQEADAEAVGSLRRTQQILEEEGAICADVSIDSYLDLLAQAHAVIMKYEFARNLAPVVRRHRQALSPSLLNNVAEGFAVADSLYLDMLAVQRELRTSWHELSNGADVILTPSAASSAPKGHVHTGAPAFNKMWSVLGWPCLHLPVALTDGGLPIGVQLIADWHKDFYLLDLAATLEKKLNPKGE